MANDGGVGAGASGVFALVSDGGFDVADGGSFSDVADGEDVAGCDGGFAAGEDVLSGVGALGGQEVLGLLGVFIGVAEVDLEEGASTSGVVKDGPDDSSDIALSFGEVQVAIPGGCDSFLLGSPVDGSLLTLSLACIDRDLHRITLPILPQ